MRRVMLFVLPLLIMLSGCQTTNPDGTGKYNFFFSPADHVAELLQTGDVATAATVYNEHVDFFDETDAAIPPLEDQLAEAVEPLCVPEADASLQAVQAVQWPVPSKAWPAVKAVLDRGDAALAGLRSQKVLQLERHSPPVQGQLEQALAETREQLTADAPRAFDSFPLDSETNFFKAYPVAVSPKELIKKREEAFHARLEQLDFDGLTCVQSVYKDDLDENEQHFLGTCYFEKCLPAKARKRDLSALLEAVQKTTDAGFTLKEIPDAGVCFVEVTSPTLLKEGQIEFPVAVDVDLPFHAEKAELQEAFDSDSAKSADYLVVVNMAMAKTQRDVNSTFNTRSEFLAGYREVPNPDYAVVQQEVNTARVNLQNTQVQSAIQQSSATTPLASAFSGIANIFAESAAQNKLEEAMEKLRTTPIMNKEPVYQPYAYNLADVDAHKTATVNYYIIDRKRRIMFTDTFDATQSQSFKVAYGLHEKDRNRESVLSASSSESDVDAFEKEPIPVSLSSILNQFVQKRGKTQKIGSLAAIEQKLMEDRNVALAAVREEQYSASSRYDGRFDSVVMIVNPSGSLGSGFYIRDDLILTNFHVVEGVKYVEMKRFDGRETFGKVIAQDVRQDLAVVRVQDRGKPVQFYNEKELPYGSTLEVIGAPKGFDFSLSRGIVSAIRTYPSIYGVGGKPVLFVQTDAAINHGNSGGPVFLKDKVVGVSDWGLDNSPGLNFCIHYSEVMSFLDRNKIKYSKGE